MSSYWYDEEVKEGVTTQVSFSSLDKGLKLRSPSPIKKRPQHVLKLDSRPVESAVYRTSLTGSQTVIRTWNEWAVGGFIEYHAGFLTACLTHSISQRHVVRSALQDRTAPSRILKTFPQNCRIWSEANPQEYVETPLHPEKLTVWCALWAGGIIGPYFFKNDEGHNVTVNGDRYRAMITNFFIPELNNHDVQELWFQQDGATCHTARATIDLLKDTFGDRLISRFGPVNWPPRSCDLTPLDYFLWGYVKSLVYADKPQTLDHLEDNIRRVIADIRPQMLEKVFENRTSRLDYIRVSRGSHMPEIIFKM
ncbi:putative transposable element [Trichonephila clavipes]|nr:putative transposable element [Trichonephila clavipes]